jgi:mRNA interferase YafQ
MMELQIHKGFTKDLNKAKLNTTNITKPFGYVTMLTDNQPLPKEAKDHELSGNYQHYREFHISGDMLVMYKKTESTITLVRMGTHSQLFK